MAIDLNAFSIARDMRGYEETSPYSCTPQHIADLERHAALPIGAGDVDDGYAIERSVESLVQLLGVLQTELDGSPKVDRVELLQRPRVG